MPKRAAHRFSAREREIMDAVFALENHALAEDIRARLTDPPSHSAVRVMLSRLEAKGYLRHEQEGGRNIYSATIRPSAAKRSALQQYLQTFFAGSLRQMVAALLREGSWSDEDLEVLRAEIEHAKKQRKSR